MFHPFNFIELEYLDIVALRIVSGDERLQSCKELFKFLENSIPFSIILIFIAIRHLGATPGVAVEVPGHELGNGILEHWWKVLFVLS